MSMASSNLSGFPNASRPAPRKLIPRSETKRYYSSVSHATRHHRCLSYLGATQQVEADTALLRHREVLAPLASRSRPEVGVLTELALLRLLHPLP